MAGFIVKRLLLLIPTALGAVSLVFFAIRLAPGDPVQVLLGDFATPQPAVELRHQYGLDQPLVVQYLVFLKDAVTLDFGKSYATNRSALQQIVSVLPFSMELAGAAVVLTVAIGVPAGIVAATHARKWIDGGSMVVALALVSLPNFYFGVLLLSLFSIKLNLLPVTGVGTVGDAGSMLSHLILPAIALAGGGIAIVARMTRSSLLEVLGREYIVAARSRGLAERAVMVRHALKNALIPVTTVTGLQIGRLIGFSVVIETVFARAGVGKLIVDSITARDYIQVQAAIIVLAFMFVLINLLTDLAYGFLDPRIRFG
jgi:peptide/nickel transport system permease protein